MSQTDIQLPPTECHQQDNCASVSRQFQASTRSVKPKSGSSVSESVIDLLNCSRSDIWKELQTLCSCPRQTLQTLEKHELDIGKVLSVMQDQVSQAAIAFLQESYKVKSDSPAPTAGVHQMLTTLMEYFGFMADTCGHWTLDRDTQQKLVKNDILIFNEFLEGQRKLTRQACILPKNVQSASPRSDIPNASVSGHVKDYCKDMAVIAVKLYTQCSQLLQFCLSKSRSYLNSGFEEHFQQCYERLNCALSPLSGSEKSQRRDSLIPVSTHASSLRAYLEGKGQFQILSPVFPVLRSYNANCLIEGLIRLRFAMLEYSKVKQLQITRRVGETETNPSHDSTGKPDLDQSLQVLHEKMTEHMHKCAHSLYGVVGSLGKLIKNRYNDPRGQMDIVNAFMLGMYIMMVGFLFHGELQKLAACLDPFLPNVRKLLKTKSAPKPGSDISSRPMKEEPKPDVAAANCLGPTSQEPITMTTGQSDLRKRSSLLQSSPESASVTTSPSLVKFVELLSSRQNVTFTRRHELDVVAHFFTNADREDSTGGTLKFPAAAPANRINHLLVWLAWEGNLGPLFEGHLDQQKGQPIELKAAQLESCVAGIIEQGYERVKQRFQNCTSLFDVGSQGLPSDVALNPKPVPISTRDELFDFCNRALEALLLINFGDVRHVHQEALSIEKQPYLKLPLLSFFNLQGGEPSNFKPRLNEGLTGFLFEFCHHAIFYGLEQEMPNLETLHDSKALLARVDAASNLLDGSLRDISAKFLAFQRETETVLLELQQCKEESASLAAQIATFEKHQHLIEAGVLERHANQLAHHSHLCEDQLKQIESNQGELRTHAAILDYIRRQLERQGQSIEKLEQYVAEPIEEVFNRLLESKGVKAQSFDHLEQIIKDRLRHVEGLLQTAESNQKGLEAQLEKIKEQTQGEAKSFSTCRSVDSRASKFTDSSTAPNQLYSDANSCALSISPDKLDIRGPPSDTSVKQDKSALEDCQAQKENMKPQTTETQSKEPDLLEPLPPPLSRQHGAEAVLQTLKDEVNALKHQFQLVPSTVLETVTKNWKDQMSSEVTEELRDLVNDFISRQNQDLEASLNAVVETCQKQLAEYERNTQAVLDTLTAKVEDCTMGIEQLRNAATTEKKNTIEAILNLTRGELSQYLVQNLSACVSKHVEYHLDHERHRKKADRAIKKISQVSMGIIKQESQANPISEPIPCGEIDAVLNESLAQIGLDQKTNLLSLTSIR